MHRAYIQFVSSSLLSLWIVACTKPASTGPGVGEKPTVVVQPTQLPAYAGSVVSTATTTTTSAADIASLVVTGTDTASLSMLGTDTTTTLTTVVLDAQGNPVVQTLQVSSTLIPLTFTVGPDGNVSWGGTAVEMADPNANFLYSVYTSQIDPGTTLADIEGTLGQGGRFLQPLLDPNGNGWKGLQVPGTVMSNISPTPAYVTVIAKDPTANNQIVAFGKTTMTHSTFIVP